MADPVRNRRVVLTYEDYLSLPNDRNRYEILEGELIVTPSPSLRHQEVSRNLLFLLFSHIKKKNLGRILYAPMDVILDNTTVVQPDLAFVSSQNDQICADRGIEGVPDLIVEILSAYSQKYDRMSKLQIYARYGVKWYWIVEPYEKTLEEYRLGEGFYDLLGTCRENEIFRPGIFPELEIDLSEVWATA